MTISVYGDSIAGGEGVNPEESWPSLLQEQLDVTVSNNSVAGETTAGLLVRFPNECVATQEDLVLFAVGINDSLFISNEKKHEVPLEHFVKNVEKLIDLCRQYTDRVVFIGLTNVDQSKTAPLPWLLHAEYRTEHIAKYDLALRDACHRKGVHHIALFSIIGPHDLIDGVHPTALGHERIAGVVKKALEQAHLL